jgi:SAM-dependent methyltransferase
MAIVRDLRSRAFAWAMAHAQPWSDRTYGGWKEALLADLDGDVLEIGCGTGSNFAWLPLGVRWSGIDPNPWMVDRAAAAGRGSAVRAGCERIPADDATFDAVVSTLVLCSVRDPAACMREARRVLRPGGRLVFIEHVAAPIGTRLRARQDAWAPMWSALTEGCHPNRDTERTIRAAGFGKVTVRAFEVPFPFGLVTPHIAGVAWP